MGREAPKSAIMRLEVNSAVAFIEKALAREVEERKAQEVEDILDGTQCMVCGHSLRVHDVVRSSGCECCVVGCSCTQYRGNDLEEW